MEVVVLARALLFCVFSCFLSISAMQPSVTWVEIGAIRSNFPKDIYDAIKKDDQAAIDYYIAAGQANMGERVQTRGHDIMINRYGVPIGEKPMLYGQDAHCSCYGTPFCCCPCFPLCCAPGMGAETALYLALKRSNIVAARKLIMNGDARLNAGKWRNVFSSTCLPCFCALICTQRLSLNTAAELLAKKARRHFAARELLHDAIVHEKILLSSSPDGVRFPQDEDEFVRIYQAADDKMCDELIRINDPELLQQVVEHHVVHPGLLLCVALERRRHIELDATRANVPSEALWNRMCAAVGKFGDYRLVDMLLLRGWPLDFERILEQAVVSGNAGLVAMLLARHPARELVTRVMPRARNRVVAQQLFDYNAALATGCYVNKADAVSAAVSVHEVGAVVQADDHATVTASESMARADKCPICFELLSTRAYVRTLPCGHNVHGDCASGWLAAHHSCPVCRAVIP